MDALLRLLQPGAQLVDDRMELGVAHQGGLQCRLPARRRLADALPALVVAIKAVAQGTRRVRVQRVRGQVVTDHVQRGNDALVRLQVEEELAVIGDDVLQLLDVAGRLQLDALRALGELQPLFEAPQVVVDLLPVALRAERTSEAGGIAVMVVGGLGKSNYRLCLLGWLFAVIRGT